MAEPSPSQDEASQVSFLIFSTFAMFWMVLGAGTFYSGLTRKHSALIQLAYSIITLSVVSLQWVLLGYTLVASDDGGPFLGTLKYLGYRHIFGQIHTIDNVQQLAWSLFSSMFSSVTGSLMVGCVTERGRVIPAVVFLFIWSTLVYDPIAYWTWNNNGWAWKLGVIDYAGGTPVHVTSGFSALAYSFVLGKRRGHGTSVLNYRPHSAILVVLGTAFLWAGWIGFNCGSAKQPNSQALVALINTQLSAGTGGMTWALIDFRLDHKWSIVGFCSGIVSGLVCITPAAGLVTPLAAPIFGIIGGMCCNFSTRIKFRFDIDDALDVLAIHGAGGVIGTILTGIFALESPMSRSKGGLVTGNFVAVFYQIIGCIVSASYSFGMTFLILRIMQRIPGLEIRATTQQEIMGMDLAEHDETAYASDSEQSPNEFGDGTVGGVTNINGLLSPGMLTADIDGYDFTTTDEDDNEVNNADTYASSKSGNPVTSTESQNDLADSARPLLG